MKNEEIKKIWNRVFPNSLMYIQKASFSDYYFYDGFLEKDKNEFANKIIYNRVLNYSFNIQNGIYEEDALSILVNPKNKYVAFSIEKMRKKTIKDITSEKLEKRFLQIKQFIIDNKDDIINKEFNINEKV